MSLPYVIEKINGHDSQLTDIANHTEIAYVDTTDTIWIDTINKAVSIYYNVPIYTRYGFHTIAPSTPYAKSYIATDNDIILVYLDLNDLSIKVSNLNTTTISNKCVALVYFNGVGFLKGNQHAVRYNGVQTTETKYYRWDNNAYVLPNNFYFVKGINYSIASQNFNKNLTINNNDLMYEIYSDTYIDRFINSCKLNYYNSGIYTSVLSGIKGSYFKNALRKDLTINVSGTTKTQTTPNVLCIGDSITHRQFIHFINKWLQSFNVNPTMIGTMNNLTETGSTILGEGRQGWRSTDFTGVCTHDGSPFPASNALNSLYTNPFLSGGVFNFSSYMSNQGFSGVDYVVIMVGTNDITNYSAQGTAPTVVDATIPTNIVNSINTIITSIKAYNSNIKIAVVPPVLAGVWLGKNQLYLNVAEELIYAFDNKISNVYLVGSYLTSGIMSLKVQQTGTNYSARNNTIKSQLPNDVHDTVDGARINGLWAASWIMNMLI